MTTFARPSLRIEQRTVRLQFDQGVQNKIKYAPVKSNHKDSYKVEKNGNLILTGWGYAEYVASAAVALKALGGREELRCVCGLSRRRTGICRRWCAKESSVKSICRG
jgi:hypothetical protein